MSLELPLNAAKYLTKVQISHDGLAMQALIWPCMVQLRAIPMPQSSSVLHMWI